MFHITKADGGRLISPIAGSCACRLYLFRRNHDVIHPVHPEYASFGFELAAAYRLRSVVPVAGTAIACSVFEWLHVHSKSGCRVHRLVAQMIATCGTILGKTASRR